MTSRYDYFLCLNLLKTKILVVMPPAGKERVIIHGTFIDKNCIRIVTSAKNLGVILDDELSYEAQITAVGFGTIRKLSKIKYFLPYENVGKCMCVFKNGLFQFTILWNK